MHIKLNKFEKWLVVAISLLDINTDYLLVDTIIDGKKYNISVRNFSNKAIQTIGWHNPIMLSGDHILKKYLLNSSEKPTKEELEKAKKEILKYWKKFTISAIKSGYDFS